ncbi:MAG: FAD-dependent monooxygenase [Ktedonobacteraceae bacterium]
MNSENVSVLIVGGGPAGLTSALLLARYGLSVLLIERREGTSIHPRARGLNVRTMEIYRMLGIEEEVRVAGTALAKSRYMLFVNTLAGEEIRRVPDDDLVLVGERLAQITPCNWCQCAQDELEPIVATAAREHGASLQFGTELVAFTQDTEGVTATVVERATGVQRKIQARYMIATDGAASPIRNALGVSVTERTTMGHYVNIYFRADLRALVHDRWFALCFVENADVEGIILAVNNTDRWLFNVPYAPEKGETPADFANERCIDLVRKAVGLPLLDVQVISTLPWEAAARFVEHMQVGRVFLAGDAAHVMPPAGGFGLNTGVHDAHNLAWKLAYVIKNEASPTLLETYNDERLPVARLIVEQAVGELEAETPDTPVGPPAETDGEEKDGLLNQLTVILGYKYTSRAVMADEQEKDRKKNPSMPSNGLDLSGSPGTRAPHVWVEYRGQRLSTLDLFNGNFVLFCGSDGKTWCDAARNVSNNLKSDFAIYQVGPNGNLVDLDGRWHTAYGITSKGAVLVRPDGFVAWRSVDSSALPDKTLEYVLKSLLWG